MLRPDADPRLSYEDGRVEKLMDLVEAMSHHMKAHNADTWLYLNGRILEIFKKREAKIVEEVKVYKEKKQEENNF